MHKILFAASEAHPLIKTGGLGDVAGSLPAALKTLRQDVRLVIPAYREALARAGKLKPITSLAVAGAVAPVRILEGRLPDTGVKFWLIDSPEHFDRPYGPYAGPQGQDWPDNAARFALFARAVVAIALDQADLEWQPDIVHCNDWQTGLVPALLAPEPERPATVFTIHNLAYQGLFPWDDFQSLKLPAELWSMEAMEFYSQFSFMKGGIAFADWLTTVSPSYAEEIRTPAFGCGLEGLLEKRVERLTGILNGADYKQWDPAVDALIVKNYTPDTLRLKTDNKLKLQRHFGLPTVKDIPLIGLIGRLVEQKGVDLLIPLLPELMRRPLQIMLLGSGSKTLEEALLECVRAYPKRIAVHIGFSEELAHRVEAGADMFLMPSRFEPCGLNQMYSLRYGTVPIVRRTGGLADTVTDTTPQTLKDHTATGFVFDEASPQALFGAIERALALFSRPRQWRALMQQGMARDFNWRQSAQAYLALYQQALSAPSKTV